MGYPLRMNHNQLSLARALAPLNSLLSPAIRLGLANPLPLTSGLILLEHKGRLSGKTRTTPLLCTDLGSLLVVSTVRTGSQWIRNLAATPRNRVWLRGQPRTTIAVVVQEGQRLDVSSLPDAPITSAAEAVSRGLGLSLALLHIQ